MSVALLASYVLLWLVVLGLAVVLFGVLRAMGEMTRRQSDDDIPLERDGPLIGSPMPPLPYPSHTNYPLWSTSDTTGTSTRTLLAFMSTTCQTCQHVVAPLNSLGVSETDALRFAVVLRSDRAGCEAFLSVFPIEGPVICDSDRMISKGFNVHRLPFALLYGEDGRLIRKGVIIDEADLCAVMGDSKVGDELPRQVFPPIERSSAVG